jgi:glyoxylase I family protein
MGAPGSLNHLRLSVRDPAATERLYDPVLSLLGWRQIPREDGGRAWERTAASGAAQWLIVTPVAPRHRDAPAHDRTAPGLHHLALNAQDREQVHRVHELLTELGAEILDPPAEYDDGTGAYAVFFSDPDGFKLEVVHVP